MKISLEKLPTFNINIIIATAVLYILLVNNRSFWSALFQVVDISQTEHFMFMFAVLALLFALLFNLISIFSFRPVFKPALFIIIVSSAILSYFMDNFGTIIDVHMIQNVMETDTAEAGELLSLSLLGHVLVYGIIPAIIITGSGIRNRGWKKEILGRSLGLVAITGVAAGSVYYAYKDISFVFRENRSITYLINPIFPMRSLVKYYKDQQPTETMPLQQIFGDAHIDPMALPEGRHSILVMVLGETARADNFHINGYARNTTPYIERENIINFSDTSSCGTATAISVPCIFSALDHNHYDDTLARHSENLLDALQHVGIDVLWRDNNSGCKGVCERIASESMHHLHIEDLCNTDGCYDEVLLYKLQEYIDGLDRDAVIILHQQGSHGPGYFRRYPEAFARFQPACNKQDVQNCSYDEIVNAYDNTILYTDYFLEKVIALLKTNERDYDTAMMYVSDHGESLGENGVYLHGLPYMIAPREQTRVPFMLWLSEHFSRDMHIDHHCLKEQQSIARSHDNILHSVLGVMGVKTRVYDAQQDIFSSCRSKAVLSHSQEPTRSSSHPG